MCCVVRYQLDGTIRPCHQSSTPRDWYWCSLEEERTAGHYPLLTIVLTRWGYQKMKITSPPCHWALYFLYRSSWPNHLACKKCKTPIFLTMAQNKLKAAAEITRSTLEWKANYLACKTVKTHFWKLAGLGIYNPIIFCTMCILYHNLQSVLSASPLINDPIRIFP